MLNIGHRRLDRRQSAATFRGGTLSDNHAVGSGPHLLGARLFQRHPYFEYLDAVALLDVLDDGGEQGTGLVGKLFFGVGVGNETIVDGRHGCSVRRWTACKVFNVAIFLSSRYAIEPFFPRRRHAVGRRASQLRGANSRQISPPLSGAKNVTDGSRLTDTSSE